MTMSLSGTGLAAVSLTPSSLSFGMQKVGTTSAAKTLTITNNLPTAVTITGDSFTGSNAGDFVQSATTCGASLAPSGSCTQSIEFKPSATGVRSAAYDLIDSAKGSPRSISLAVTGK
jgi:trimeric autotransporter adhesin